MSPDADAFVRFCVVGVIGFAVDAGATVYLTQSVDRDPLQARVVAFLLAATVTWALNRRFTFRSKAGVSTWVPYVMLTAVGAAINLGIYLAWIRFAGEDAFGVLSGVGAGSIAALSFNFLASRKVFARS